MPTANKQKNYTAKAIKLEDLSTPSLANMSAKPFGFVKVAMKSPWHLSEGGDPRNSVQGVTLQVQINLKRRWDEKPKCLSNSQNFRLIRLNTTNIFREHGQKPPDYCDALHLLLPALASALYVFFLYFLNYQLPPAVRDNLRPIWTPYFLNV